MAGKRKGGLSYTQLWLELDIWVEIGYINQPNEIKKNISL